ncbi:DUF1947 domain-containing protein [Candidatus Micrarchaeota archaeon]|nr:DUF1947 domain-containing protein [Candidatus Micrarchaeota archaeon]
MGKQKDDRKKRKPVRLRFKELKRLLSGLPEDYLNVSKHDQFELKEMKRCTVICVNGVPKYLLIDGRTLPTLNVIVGLGKDCTSESIKELGLSYVIVDMGAVPYVTDGADVMRPGIVSHGIFDKGAFVLICDERHNKPLAIGYSLMSSDEIDRIDKGRVIEVLHYVGDDIWEISRSKFKNKKG